jgi:hypothetical protein
LRAALLAQAQVPVGPHGLMLRATEGANTRTWSKEFLQKQVNIWDAAERQILQSCERCP